MASRRCVLSTILHPVSTALPCSIRRPRGSYTLLDVPSEERQVEDQREPVAVDKEQECQESVDGDFGKNVLVQAVAEIDRVDVVAARARYVSIAVPARKSGLQRVAQPSKLADRCQTVDRLRSTPRPRTVLV